MAPSTPKKVSKTKANTKKLIYDQATLDQKMYFLWLHLQLKQGNKLNHMAVAEKLKINYKTAFGRFGQIKKYMEQYEESLAAPALAPAADEHTDAEEDSDNGVLKKAFDDLDNIFSKGELLR